MSRPLKITIARPMLDRLEKNAALKAVFSPDAPDQRITRLVSPFERVFEREVLASDAFNTPPSSCPNGALLSFTADDIAHIEEIQKFIDDKSLDYARSSVPIGDADFTSYAGSEAQKVTNASVWVYPAYLKHYARLIRSGFIIQCDKVETKLLRKQYAEHELMSYDELLSSSYQVFVIEGDGRQVELKEGMRVQAVSNEGRADNNIRHDKGASVLSSSVEEYLLGIDEAITYALKHLSRKNMKLLKYTVGAYDPDDLEVLLKTHTIFVSRFVGSAFTAQDQAYTSQSFVLDKLLYELDNSLTYVIAKEIHEWLSADDVRNVVSLVQDSDGVTVENAIRALTGKKADYQENSVWTVDNKSMNADEVVRLLLHELCLETPEGKDAALRYTRDSIDSNSLSVSL